MSRIPIPAHHHHPRAPSPGPPSPERPNPTSAHLNTNTPMSSLSGFQSSASLSETRKKQSKRDEVSSLLN